jgi:hypothetical protein
MSTIALFVALGGVSYAATQLPAGSVGTIQLRDNAVTGRKVAPSTLGMRPMSIQTRTALGAARIRYAAAATETGPPGTMFRLGGLLMQAACRQTAPGSPTTLIFYATPSQAMTLDDAFGNDTGTDPHTPGAVTPGTLRFDLPARVRTQLGGPGPDSSHYFRTAATAIFTSRSHTIVASLVAIADGVNARCSVNGAAYLADVVTH